MNRILFFIVILLNTKVHLIAQQDEVSPLAGLRSLITELNLPNEGNVLMLLSWNDSLANRNFRLQAPYDSIMQDSVTLVQVEREFVVMDAALLQYYLKPSAQNYGKVKVQFLAGKGIADSVSVYVKELYAIMRELAIENSDYALAYSLQNKLHAFEYDDWKEMDLHNSARFDSLENVVENVEKSRSEELRFSRGQTMQWHVIAVVAIAAVLVLLILLIVLRWRWKRRMIQLIDKANDKSEEETLVQKLEQARREIAELKMVAKKQIEPMGKEAVLPLPSGQTVTSSEMAQWNDHIQQALAKIKSHCEAGKSSMGVPTYMSIVNDTSRLSTFVQQKSEEWIALLNAKKDMK
jgi:hypothetical protein